MRKEVLKDGYGEIVEKKSRFIGELHHISDADEAKAFLTAARKKYYDARHHCYAYLLGKDGENKKYGDDGEPQGTAGLPMLSILEGRSLTDCMVIVTRYFGGTLLGTGGLVRAYSAAAEAALDDAALAERIPAVSMRISTDYKNETTIRRMILTEAERGTAIELGEVTYSDKCDMTVNIETEAAQAFERNVAEALSGQAETRTLDDVFLMKEA